MRGSSKSGRPPVSLGNNAEVPDRNRGPSRLVPKVAGGPEQPMLAISTVLVD